LIRRGIARIVRRVFQITAVLGVAVVLLVRFQIVALLAVGP